ncbi:bifunctional diguanylate cyclase/phosphodiesterase [Paenibacillus sp. FJAT-26967]|uniref:putative bifunctional diguanylate cyclase/phosphodiesterase n=1 Tax=Paenibacillus sp. FJAT-26967 TaxID=1729690 RepID=UPI000838650C|nr:EAL domain-containing protein [Paenibacillus sp. FJAT-26967]
MKDKNTYTSLLAVVGVAALVLAAVFIAEGAYDLKILLPVAFMVIAFELMPIKMPSGAYYSGVTIGFTIALFKMGLCAGSFFITLNTATFFVMQTRPFLKIRWFRFFTTLGMYFISLLAAWGVITLTERVPLLVSIIGAFLAFEGVNLLLRTGIIRSITQAPVPAGKMIYEARSLQLGIIIASIVLYKMLLQTTYELFIVELVFTVVAIKIIHYFVAGYVKQIDIIEESNQRYKRMAYYDSVTGLPNRALFNERLTDHINEAELNNSKVGLLFLDLDQFKTINDTMGHLSGDVLLTQVADRLRTCIDERYTVSRLGGDEFTIIIQDIEESEACIQAAETILKALKKRFLLNGKETFMTPSIGISLYPDHGTDAEQLLKNADTAMYKAKEFGGNTYTVFVPDHQEAVEKKLVLQRNLRTALERDEFYLLYQPQLDLKSGTVQGIEALIRWNNEELGEVAPAEFIPLAEGSRLILSIGEWVLRTACAQNRAWQEEGFPPVNISVNLSSVQFQSEELPVTIQRILQETALDPKWVTLEITESLLLQSRSRTMRMLNELKATGVSIAIDDFGVGYSSLSYLKDYPFDCLKIDKSFIQHMNEEQGDELIVRTVIGLAHGLNMTVIAEGVESEEQLHYLHQQSCDSIQGFLISKPISPDQLSKQLWVDQSLGRKLH